MFVANDPVLTWVADDGRRRGDGAPVLVAHSTPEFASEHLAAPEEAAGPMAVALRDVLDIATEPTSTHVHRWTFGKPSGRREQTRTPSTGASGCAATRSPTARAWSRPTCSGRALGEALAGAPRLTRA